MESYASLLLLLNKAISEEQAAFKIATPKEMYNAMDYMIGLGGKRIRPLLTLVGCDLFDADPKQAIQAALAVELFHNFSLIHDDILDKAPLRRGHQTVHEKWNHNIAILSGDGMLVKAFDVLAKSNPKYLPEVMKLFSKTSLEICEGQQEDMNFETQSVVSVPDYIHMITLKTAVLLGCSLQMGAICAHANIENQMHIYEFGKHIGIAFQILDDVLDVYANEKFGKQVGGDIIANKKTFLLLKAFELANHKQHQQLSLLINDTHTSNVNKINEVTSIYNQLQIKEIATKEANRHTEIALQHLDMIHASPSKKEELKVFALHLLNREI